MSLRLLPIQYTLMMMMNRMTVMMIGYLHIGVKISESDDKTNADVNPNETASECSKGSTDK